MNFGTKDNYDYYYLKYFIKYFIIFYLIILYYEFIYYIMREKLDLYPNTDSIPDIFCT